MSLRTCNTVNQGCKAPAGYQTGGGIAEGTTSCRSTCFACGEPVCSSSDCSKIVSYYRYGRKRVCAGCQQQHASGIG